MTSDALKTATCMFTGYKMTNNDSVKLTFALRFSTCLGFALHPANGILPKCEFASRCNLKLETKLIIIM